MELNVPFKKEDLEKLKTLSVGDRVKLTGTIYTGRDAAHKRLVDLVNEGKDLPVDLKDQVIYYVGPTPKKEGRAIGSAGPTTSYRMDPYAPTLLDLGLKGMIGKGARSKEVRESIVKNKGVYFVAIGGAAALISRSIVKSEIVAYEDLGAEAIRKLEVKEFPVIVANNLKGEDIYESEQKKYRK